MHAQANEAPSAAAEWTDECSAIPGYLAFRSKLEQAVAAKDGVALRALFHPQGSMRVNGIGGDASFPDWGFDRPHAATVWPELEQILALGCVRQGDRLLMPAMAALVEDPTVAPEAVMALEQVAVRASPDPDAAVIRTLAPREMAQLVWSGEPAGWDKVIVDGQEGFASSFSLRSPYSFQLVLVPFEDGWRIREFVGGI